MGDILREHINVLLFTTSILSFFIISIINMNDRFVSFVAVIVNFHLLFGLDLWVIGDDMFLGVDASRRPVDIIEIIAMIELP